jgi:hypothetical protein
VVFGGFEARASRSEQGTGRDADVLERKTVQRVGADGAKMAETSFIGWKWAMRWACKRSVG